MIALVFLVAAVAGLLAAEWADSRVARAFTKMIAASGFVAVALASGALSSSYGQFLLAGLVSCWIGDALLLSPGQSTKFQMGIAAFLLGHLGYAIAFSVIGYDPRVLGLAGGVIAVGAWGVLRWLRPHVPADFRMPVLAYIGVISAMVALSIAAVGAGAPAVIAVGAVGFALSDISVARDRFVAPGFVNAAWGLPLYFGSQFLLATSVAVMDPSGA